MALEASDRLIDIIWVNWRCTCGCISRPTFKLSASLLDIMGKSKEISQDLRKRIVELHKSGSSLREISKCLKVPCSSVQTIVHKYKHHGTTQSSHRSGRRHVLSPRDLVIWCEKCKSFPVQQRRTLWKCWRKQVQKYLYPQWNESYIDNLKGRSARLKPLLQNRHRKSRLQFATPHGGKYCTFWRNVFWSDETIIEL